MSSTMAIVLPSRKKKSDIFAPSKAIQDAKEKLGPGYFDISLLECSRNAVELTKLIGRWEVLEKEKLKVIRDIDREQGLLVRSVQAHRTNNNMHDKKRDHVASAEGIETLDGKSIAPGFRFKSNGDIKPSALTLPLVDIDAGKNDNIPDMSEMYTKGSNSKTVGKKYDPVGNYEREISELETIIRGIHKDLSKFKIGTEKFPSSERFHTYLRAHRNNYVSIDEFNNAHFSNSPNARFAFRPGSLAKLHKPGTKTPTFRSCTGCKFKLRCNVDDDNKLRKAQSEDLSGKRRWSYVPSGKYVQSTCSIFPRNSKTQTRELSCETEQSQTIIKDRAKSMVHFQTSKEEMASRAMSEVTVKSPRRRSGKTPSIFKSPTLSADSKKSMSIMSDRDRSLSCVSALSGISCTRVTSNLLIDHEARFRRLKRLQEEEQQHCDYKVKAFLRKLGSSTNV